MPSTSVPPPAVDALPRQYVRDPDFWIALLAWSVIAFSCAQILLLSFGRDQGIYAVIGEGILHGQMPYRDLWDFKPPGIHLVYALAQALFGRSMTAIRLLEVAGLLASVAAWIRLGDVFFGLKRVGLLGAALAALIHAQLDFWHTAQPETFGGFLTAWALLFTARATQRGRHPSDGRAGGIAQWAEWAAVGFLFGCAALLKPPLGGGALVCVAYLVRAERDRSERLRRALAPLLAAGLASVIPIGLCALWFRLGGAWQALHWTMFDFTPGYTKLGWEDRSAPQMFYQALHEGFFRFSALAGAGVIAAAVIAPMHSREREGMFLVLGVMSVHFAGIAMQGKFFPYHYGATLPLIAFLAGLGLYKLWRRCLTGGAGGVLAYASFIVVAAAMWEPARDLPGSFWWRSRVRLAYLFGQASFETREMLDRTLYYVADYSLDADRRLAHTVRRLTHAKDPVFIWGFEPVVYWLAERKPASRFIYDVPQRARWEQAAARAELMRDLRRTPPEVFAIQSRDIFPAVTGALSDSRRALDSFPELRELLNNHYARVEEVEDFEVYVQKELATRRGDVSPDAE